MTDNILKFPIKHKQVNVLNLALKAIAFTGEMKAAQELISKHGWDAIEKPVTPAKVKLEGGERLYDDLKYANLTRQCMFNSWLSSISLVDFFSSGQMGTLEELEQACIQGLEQGDEWVLEKKKQDKGTIPFTEGCDDE